MLTTPVASKNGCDHQPMQRVQKEFVTPQRAAEWLVKNTHNRRLTAAHVETLAASLERGEWMLNGETIKFSSDGRLLDGQHRLNACVQSATGFWTYVAYGVEPEAFDTIDVNMRARKTSDILSLHGMENTSQLAACVKLIWMFSRCGQFFDGGAGHTGFSPKVCLEIINRRPAIQQSVSLCCSARVFPSPSLLAALHYIFSCADSEMAGDFISAMRDGSDALDRPFNVFRETVISRRLSARRVGVRPLASMAIRAWNSELSGQWIKRVYYKPNETFPTISGFSYERMADCV